MTHDYECPDCGWTSTGWPTKKQRDERGRQHRDEHATAEPMPELVDFLKER